MTAPPCFATAWCPAACHCPRTALGAHESGTPPVPGTLEVRLELLSPAADGISVARESVIVREFVLTGTLLDLVLVVRSHEAAAALEAIEELTTWDFESLRGASEEVTQDKEVVPEKAHRHASAHGVSTSTHDLTAHGACIDDIVCSSHFQREQLRQ